MRFFRDIEIGSRSKEDDLDETASMPSENSKTKVIPTIDPSVVSIVETLHERHRIEDENERQSNLCCGSCCDLLRACIIVDIVFILLDIVGILLFFAGITINNSRTNDDDEYDDEKSTDCWGCNSNILNVLIIKNSLGMVFCTIGIIGAAKFHKILVLITAIWYVIDFIWSIITRRWTGIVVTACFAYPHFALFMALKKQQITRENYARERYCCCDKE